MSDSTQLVVVGAGPGGYAAAFYASDRGMQVSLVDPSPNPGGVCLYRGCIPSKALLHVAEIVNEAKHAAAWGVTFGAPAIEIDKVRAFKDRVVTQLTSGVGQVAKLRKINYVQGTAAFRDARTLEIAKADGTTSTLAFEHAVIATGSRPATVPGLSIKNPRVMDSTAALDLPDIPKSLLVVGGGYIGLELGSVYAALGSKVTVVEMTDGLLPGADRDLVNILAKRIGSICEAVLLNTKVASVKDAKDGVTVTFEGQLPEGMANERTFDRVLVAVGRRPNSEVPGLDKTRVKVNAKGFIDVDEARATAEPTIYAIGDVAGEPMLAHKATHEARVAVDAIARRARRLRARSHSRGGLHRSRGRVVRPDRERSREAEARGHGHALPLGRVRTRDYPRPHRRHDQAGDRSRSPTASSASASSAPVPANSSPRRCWPSRWARPPTTSSSPSTRTRRSRRPIMEAAEVFFGESTHVYKPKRK